MNFYFCETCGKRVTEIDIERGAARDKKLKGVYCQSCAVGIHTMDMAAINLDLLDKKSDAPEAPSPVAPAIEVPKGPKIPKAPSVEVVVSKPITRKHTEKIRAQDTPREPHRRSADHGKNKQVLIAAAVVFVLGGTALAFMWALSKPTSSAQLDTKPGVSNPLPAPPAPVVKSPEVSSPPPVPVAPVVNPPAVVEAPPAVADPKSAVSGQEVTLTFTLQNGRVNPEVKSTAYKDSHTATMHGTPGHTGIVYPSAQNFICDTGRFYGLVSFALTQDEGGPLPNDVVVLEAKLHLYKASTYSPFIELQRVLAPWTAAEVTWDSASKSTRWKTPGGEVVPAIAATLDLGGGRKGWQPQWCTFDVGDSLRDALKEHKNYGWRVCVFGNKDHIPNGNIVSFAASDNSSAYGRPRLELKVRMNKN